MAAPSGHREMLKKMSIFTRTNGFTWVQNISGANVEELVDFHTVNMVSFGFKTFREGDVDEHGDLQRRQLRS